MKRKINGEGTIYYDEKRKRFIAQCSLGRDENGKLIRKSLYAKTKSEVLKKMLDIQAKYNIGAYTDAKSMTLAEWMIKWFEVFKINDYKKATYEKEFARSKKIRNAQIGKMVLDKIKPSDIQKFVNDLAKKLSSKTIRNIIILLNGAMKQAIAEQLIYTNPCLNVSMPRLVKPDMIALNKTEKEKFLEVAKHNNYYDFFLFALNTGMRESEICGLTRDNIDLKNGIITINKQLVRLKGEYVFDTPKTKQSIRKIPINQTARNIIEKYIKREYKDNLVFYNPVNFSTLKQNTLCNNARKVFDECYKLTKNEKYNQANFHTLRHTFATSWIVQGGNVVLLSKALGHTDTAFTMRVYVQPSSDDVASEMLNMNF